MGIENQKFLELTVKHISICIHLIEYKKPMQTDHINSNSNHPHQRKMAVFYCYTHRLLIIPLSNQKYNNEISTLNNLLTTTTTIQT